MKNLLILTFVSICSIAAAQSMGTIDDPVAGSNPTAKSSDRIAFLHADIEEKTKLYQHECLMAARSGNVIKHSVYQDAIKQDKLELMDLEKR